MNETPEDYLKQTCELLETLVPMLQNSIDLIKKDKVSTEKQLWHTSGKVIVTIYGIPIRCKDVKDTLIAVIKILINKFGAEIVFNKCEIIKPTARPFIKKITDRESEGYERLEDSPEYEVLTGTHTPDKIDQIREICKRFEINVNIERIFDVETNKILVDTEQIKQRETRKKIRDVLETGKISVFLEY